MLGHARHGVDFAQIDDLDERIVRLDRLPRHDLHRRDEAAERRGERDASAADRPAGGSRCTTASAPFSICVSTCAFTLDARARHAAADDRAMSRRDVDAPEREDGFLEVGLLDFHRFDAEILHAGFVEDDRVGHAFGVHFFLGKTEAGSGKEDQDGKEAFHYFEVLEERLDWPVAATWRMRAR